MVAGVQGGDVKLYQLARLHWPGVSLSEVQRDAEAVRRATIEREGLTEAGPVTVRYEGTRVVYSFEGR